MKVMIKTHYRGWQYVKINDKKEFMYCIYPDDSTLEGIEALEICKKLHPYFTFKLEE